MATERPKQSSWSPVFERQAQLCKAFAHPSRLQILDLLGNGEVGVSALQQALGVSKTRISQHLTILKSAGVISTRRNGKQVICSLAIPEVKQACEFIRRVLEVQFAENRRLMNEHIDDNDEDQPRHENHHRTLQNQSSRTDQNDHARGARNLS